MAGRAGGLYEVLITEALKRELDGLEPDLVDRAPLEAVETADRLAFHLGRVLTTALESVSEEDRVEVGLRLATQLVEQIGTVVEDPSLSGERPGAPGAVLRAVTGRLPDGRPEAIPSPLLPLLDTALLTNAPGEPRVGAQLLAEIPSAQRIDLVMAFIRRSGLRPLLPALEAHLRRGRPLRVLTTTYTNSTECEALELLARLGAQVRVSYEEGSTRLHAKSWLFLRDSGFSTAYVGSSNLTHSAQVTGLEWNVRVSGARNPSVVEKIAAVFGSYWESGDFVPFEPAQFRARTARAEGEEPALELSPLEVRLEPFQERLLELVALSRGQGHHRNLLVAATGTGKTVMAAVDYAQLRAAGRVERLLFVAHREEILSQSRRTFRHVLRDPTFGELWVAGSRPEAFQHVFASIQSLAANGLQALDPSHFDLVVVDEFHHAAADSYRELLEKVRPAELLGLTATPERSDGLSVLQWFDGRIAAELRLWDAIDQHRLTPFAYFGVHDGLDFTEVPWRRGQGYDVPALENVLTGNHAWARLVVQQVRDRVERVSAMKALGFCVSVGHARFMAEQFNAAGIASVAVWADTPAEERRSALVKLARGELNAVFSVDLFNEGVDVPLVDTLLFLRPTDSPTLFLQQLGRGLRKGHGKTVCTVLDFVAQHRREFRFDRRFRALVGGTRTQLRQQVEQGFPYLPAGCHLELDRVASEVVLRSLKDSVPSQWTRQREELAALARAGGPVTLERYLAETGLELEDLYSGEHCWSLLQGEVGLPVLPPGPHELPLRRALGRLLHTDDPLRLDTWRRFLEGGQPPAVSSLPVPEQRLLRMLVATMLGRAAAAATTLEEGAALLWRHPQILQELRELLTVLAGRTSHLTLPLPDRPQVPLLVHASYSRLEILAGFGVGTGARVAPWQTGVYFAPGERADLLAFTLDKTQGHFSPTTRYRDYAISRERIHWESQSVTREDGETGQRYQHHQAQGSSVMLFARLRSTDRAFTFLGPADYEGHQGERPMRITWRLHQPLPGDLFAAYAAAVA